MILGRLFSRRSRERGIKSGTSSLPKFDDIVLQKTIFFGPFENSPFDRNGIYNNKTLLPMYIVRHILAKIWSKLVKTTELQRHKT